MSYITVINKENAIVLTTPKRNELLRDGPTESMSHRCHVLGRGAYGTVFKAVYRDHSVALKVIKNSAISTLHNESHVLNWNHKNIVRLMRVESNAEFGLLIMERPNGLCLQRVTDTLVLPLVHRVVITLDVLAALSYCHGQGVLHLDVKPPNILIALGGKPNSMGKQSVYYRSYICKLCDFGSSVKLDELCSSQMNTKGTLRYMSPEALRSAPLTCASDIYSLGITMWQLQARHLPFYQLNCNDTIAYQVVKYDLRPDNSALLEELQLGSDHTEIVPLISCDCEERGQGIKNNNAVDRMCRYMNRNNPQLDVVLSTELYKKARRNLNFDSSHGRVSKRTLKQRSKQPRLANYFDNLSTISVTYLESAYSELYKSCWLSQPQLRLSSIELQKHLELILAKCFAN
ncbi:serine/threonine-protein kinase mos [Drosophila nasuta]|uniref:serine/threonine-protein kinase mos n=1 Tax=Drosophila nasuta TaxID=42062 RepID=UPI00295EFF37|nr:serine/threonine-protein kinase mos [Drosophila nasuta]